MGQSGIESPDPVTLTIVPQITSISIKSAKTPNQIVMVLSALVSVVSVIEVVILFFFQMFVKIYDCFSKHVLIVLL